MNITLFKLQLNFNLLKKLRILVFFLSIFICSITANAQQALNQDVLNEIDQDITEILESPEFDPWEVRDTWKWKRQEKDTRDVKESDIDTRLLVEIARIIAGILPWLLILSLLIFLIAIIIIKKNSIIGFFRALSIKNNKEKTRYLQGNKIERSVLP